MKKNLYLLVLLLLPILFCSQGVFSMDNRSPNISGLPILQVKDIPKPAGEPGNLVVLDWAGFKSAVTYTYDDAQPSHVAHYAELQATGVPMTFFVSSNVNWLPNSDPFWAQVVKDGNEIGNHTVSHPYSSLNGSCFGKPLDSIDAEIDECTKYIIERFGQSDVWTMAAPYGDKGYKEYAKTRLFLNRGVNSGTIAPNDDSDPFNMPCFMANGGESATVFNREIDSAESEGKWLIFLFHSIDPTSDKWYATVDIAEITQSIDHAKSLGDIWIDTFANVGAYWMGQKLLTSATPTKSGDELTWTWTLPEHFPKGKYLRVKVDGGTLKQGGKVLEWDSHGYYEIALDEGSLTLVP